MRLIERRISSALAITTSARNPLIFNHKYHSAMPVSNGVNKANQSVAGKASDMYVNKLIPYIYNTILTTCSGEVLFVDLDNTLYPKSYKIHDMMSVKISEYFKNQFSLTHEEARNLHMKYYEQYGLALEGLVRHHKIGKNSSSRLLINNFKINI